MSFNSVKVFSATTATDRESLGERVSRGQPLATYDNTTGRFTVPARTAVVWVEN